MVTNPVPGTEGVDANGLSWSPGSDEIAFSTSSDLKKMARVNRGSAVECTVAIVEQTKIELSVVEQDVRWKG